MTVESNKLGTVKIIYILYLIGILFVPTAIVGIVMAYSNRGDAPEWLRSHYIFLIRTFWIYFLIIVASAFLALVFIGFFGFLFSAVWLLIRCVKGMKCLDEEKPHPNPKGWLFS